MKLYFSNKYWRLIGEMTKRYSTPSRRYRMKKKKFSLGDVLRSLRCTRLRP